MHQHLTSTVTQDSLPKIIIIATPLFFVNDLLSYLSGISCKQDISSYINRLTTKSELGLISPLLVVTEHVV